MPPVALRLWLGFPKSLDISKAIDKKLGAEREVVGKGQTGLATGFSRDTGSHIVNYKEVYNITVPATPEAQQWDGWGTALKPANEPIVLARKPLSEKTIAENVLKWGTGGLNIDATRIPTDETLMRPARQGIGDVGGWSSYKQKDGMYGTPLGKGRFPANVILDEEAGKMLDGQSGISKSTGGTGEKSKQWDNGVIGWKGQATGGFGDTGGASRFFYCAKASKKERGESNTHPTVKPLALMRYLVRLVTPPDGTVLDPFAGSGSTLVASMLEGFNFIGFEISKEYCIIAEKRISQMKRAIKRVEKIG